MNQAMQPIGILGGTFDPIHYGHLRLALELYERLALAEVRLIPAAHPPHRAKPIATGSLRWQMLQAAIAGIAGLIGDDRELHQVGPSYTVNTLDSLRHAYPDTPLCLVLGMDAFLGLPQWYQWERLLTLAHLLVVPRPDSVLPQSHVMYDFLTTHQLSHQKTLKHQLAGGIWVVEAVPLLAISATQIRTCIKTGKNPHYLLPPPVLDIIATHQLYR